MATSPQPLLERAAELTVLGELCDALAEGAGSAVALVGPPGIGKTSLVGEVTALGLARGVAVVGMRGGRLEQDLAFAGVRQLFLPLLRSHPDVLADATPSVARLLSRQQLRGGMPPDQALLFEGLVWTLSDVAERKPVLIVADDVHWFDVPTLRFLGFLTRRVPQLPVAVVLATRPAEGPVGQVLTDLLLDPDLHTLRPAPLSLHGVGRLVARHFDVEPAAEFTQACASAAGGNPFLTGALLGAMAAGKVRPDAAGVGAVGASGVPGVRIAILDRLRCLPPDAELLARAVAVLGLNADTYAVGRLGNLTPAALAVAADALSAAGILTAERPLSFVHPLVRQVVYEEIPAGARSMAHRGAADLLAALSAGPGAVAAHLLATDPAGDAWVVDRLAAAAEEAAAEGAPEMAVPFLLRALEEPPAPERRHQLHVRAGALAQRAGLAIAVPLLQEAFEAAAGDDVQRLTLSLHLRSAIVASTGDLDAAVVTTRQVYEEAGDPAVRHEALSALAHSRLLVDASTSVSPFFEEFLASADLDTPDLPAPSLGLRSFAGTSAGEPVDDLVRAAVLALHQHERDAPGTAPSWIFHAGATLLYAGHPGLLELAGRAIEIGRRDGNGIISWVGLYHRSWWHLFHGDLSAAERDARQALDLVSLWPYEFYVAGPLATVVDVLLRRGEVDAAQRALSAHGLEGAPGPVQNATALLLARARLRAEQGRGAEAIADLRTVGRRAVLGGKVNPGIYPWRSELALLLRTTGRDEAEARALVEEELHLAIAYGSDRAMARARRAAGIVTGDEGLTSAALADFRSAGDKLGIADTLVDLGAMQRRRGSDLAVDTLRLGLDTAAAIGAGAIVTRARGELALTGTRPQRNRLTGTEALTPAELRTARLAAIGASNREIAQTAYLSLKTVETQLAAAYRKLDCGRPGLSAALALSALEHV